MAISTNGTIIARLAGGLYNQTLSSASYNEVVSSVKSAADINALANNLVATDFAGKTDAQIASVLLFNLGLSSVAGLNNWVAAQITAAGATGKGAKIVSLLNDFSNLTSDATYGASASSFNTKVDAALALSQTADFKGGDLNAAATLAAAEAAAAKAAADAAAAKAAADALAAENAPQTFKLTKELDSWLGKSGNDTVNAILSSSAGESTLTALDDINGGAGNDTLNIYDLTGGQTLPASAKIKGIETVNFASAGAVSVDTTGINVSDVATLNIVQGSTVGATAAGTTNVNVAGVTGNVGVNGGAAVTVNGATATQDVVVGAATVSKGAVTVTHTNETTGNIEIDGGTSVSVTASKASTGHVYVGQGGALDGSDQPSGAITINTTGKAYAAADSAATRGAITTTGGSTVSVTQTASSSTAAAATDTTNVNNGVTQSAVTVNGGKATTSVTVSQSAPATARDAVVAVAGVKEVATITINSTLADNAAVTYGGLTFTNKSGATMTAAQVAGAFANLSAGATAGTSTLGVYSGTWTANGSTGGVTNTSATVSTISATAKAAAAGNAVGGAGALDAASVVTTAGVTAIDAVTGVMGVAGGVVHVTDYGYGDALKADSITSATLNGYAAGSYVKSDALTTLSLANSAGSFSAYNGTATALDLTLNKVTGSVTVDAGGNTFKTLNVTATGTKSTTALTAAAVTALKVSGDVALSLTGSTLTALKTVTVTGAAGLTIDASGANVTAVDSTATTGSVTATVNATNATYTGGAGVDKVTLSTNTVAKAINTGAGNDTVTLAALGTTALTGLVSGGDGTDTLVMNAADAATASATDSFGAKIDGFEKLSLGQVQAGDALTVNMTNMDSINYVVTNGTAVATQEVATVTFSGAKSGQSVTFNGLTVTANGTDLTPQQVATAFATGTQAGATVTGTAGAAYTAGTAISGAVVYTSVATGNQTDLGSAGVSTAAATAPVAPTVVTTQGVAATIEHQTLAFSALQSGESTSILDGQDAIWIQAPPATLEYNVLTDANAPSFTLGSTLTIGNAVYTLTQMPGGLPSFQPYGGLVTLVFYAMTGTGGFFTLTSGTADYTASDLDQNASTLKLTAVVAGDVSNLTSADISYAIMTNGSLGSAVSSTTVQNFAPVTTALTASDIASQVADYLAGGTNHANVTGNSSFANWTASQSVGGTLQLTAVTPGNVPSLFVWNNGPYASATVFSNDGVDAITESSAVTFTALKSGQSVTVDGYTYTAPTDKTAAQVATAVATGFNGAGFTVSASGATVSFTSTTVGTNVTDLAAPTVANAVAPLAPSVSTVDGKAAGTLTLSNVVNASTVELNAILNGALIIAVKDATTGTSDSVTLVANVDGSDVNFQTVTVANVETVNVNATDITPVDEVTGLPTISKATLTVTDAAAKAVVVTGNADIALTAASTVLTSIDATALTGKFQFSSEVNSAYVTGGSAADTLTGSGNSQTLSGGNGDDILTTTGDLATLIGGAGKDTFNVADPTTSVSSYATIVDATAGDKIKFDVNAVSFKNSKLTLGDTAVFQDYANSAIASNAAGVVSWFQFAGNTYVVENAAAGATDQFINGADLIVKLTGLVDLSNASFNSTANILQLN